MLRGRVIRLLPTSEQEKLFWQSAGTKRWVWNYFLGERTSLYIEWEKLREAGDTKVTIAGLFRKKLTQLKKTDEYKWLKNVGSNVAKQAVIDADNAFKDYRKGIKGKPKFKSKKESKVSFYVNYESFSWRPNGFHGEKIGYVKTVKPLPKLKTGKYSNPHISFDGKHWFVSFCLEAKRQSQALTNECVGIDLGVKEFAVVYSKYAKTHEFYKNINKSKKVKRLKKKLKREERKASRKFLANVDHYEIIQREGKKAGKKTIYKRPLRECCNINRQNTKIRFIYQKLTNIRNNYIHQITSKLVKTKPAKIVIEDLNIQGMMKNKHLSKAISEQKFYEFRRQLKYKCKFAGIELTLADRFYASSKECSCCHHKNKALKLSDRIYKCPKCGLTIDRDLNAAINLANYKTA